MDQQELLVKNEPFMDQSEQPIIHQPFDEAYYHDQHAQYYQPQAYQQDPQYQYYSQYESDMQYAMPCQQDQAGVYQQYPRMERMPLMHDGEGMSPMYTRAMPSQEGYPQTDGRSVRYGTDEERVASRLNRNKEAAKRNRQKKKEYLKLLEEDTRESKSQLAGLRVDVVRLESDFLELQKVLRDKGYQLANVPHYLAIMNGFSEGRLKEEHARLNGHLPDPPTEGDELPTSEEMPA